MKKALILCVLAICSFHASAQIVFENGNLNEALEKAKKEAKLVFVDCYTSWCGPCKMLANNIFPTKEVGDYMNKKFVNFKIDMEKGEGPVIMKKYNISVYPTLLLLNSDGSEFSRVIGGESDPAKFIDTLESISNPKSNIAEKREKFKRTLDGANEFIQILNDNYFFEERDLALVSVYGRRKTSENFKPENFKLYKNLITTIYHPVALSIMNAGNEAIKFLGKKEYSDFVQSKVDMTLVDMAMRNKISGEKIYELVTMSKKYKEMQTPLLNYYHKIGNYIDDKNVEAIIAFSTKSFKSLSTVDRANVARFTHRIATTNSQIEKMIPFYEHCINVSGTDKEKKKYTDSLNLVKNLLQAK